MKLDYERKNYLQRVARRRAEAVVSDREFHQANANAYHELNPVRRRIHVAQVNQFHPCPACSGTIRVGDEYVNRTNPKGVWLSWHLWCWDEHHG